ncbi:hemagglutinin repeat-containing protein [Siccibacter turicensis]|uniref:hemagglutinin repeat-containing protein n=1 Tax=Siccibacter turicensis TaxID=357233 RepID=UPI0039C99CDB
MDNHALPVKFSQRAVSWLIISLLVWQPVAPAFAAAITPNSAASMDKAANGVPVVNIAPPNAAGLSHNQFKDYNVGKEGLILNNATGQLNRTQLGGIIQNNPNLKAGREAKGIINEVTGGSRSRLEGYTEVAGKGANVMVANPFGITCNGCGFINTPQATLTTGKPQFDSKGNLLALDVTRGSITVEGKGLDASNSDALSLISRATEVNAAIHAKDLTVTAGANRVGADGSVTPISGTGSSPTVAVDTGALGGMYANRIHLVSSEKGVGVNLGNLNARQGDITLSASGKLVMKDSLASGALTARADGVQLSGEHKTGGALNVTSTGDLRVQNATLASDGRLTLSGKDTTALAGSTLTSGGTLALNGQQVTLDNTSRADGAQDVTLRADAIAQQGTLLAGGNATLEAARLDNRGMVAAKGQLTAKGETLTNRGTLQGRDLTLVNTATDNSGTLAADRALKVDTRSLTTGADAVLTSKGDIALNAGSKADLNGRVNARGGLTVAADDIRTRESAQLQSEGDVTLTGKTVRLDGTQASKGTLSAKADTLVHGGKSNASAVRLEAARLNNTGTVVADTLNVKADDVNNSGLLLANGTQTLNARALTNSGTQGAEELNLAADSLSNSGTLQGTGQFTVTGQTINNVVSGKMLSAGALNLNAGTLENLGLIQGQDTSLTASTIRTGSGSYTLSGGALTLDAGQLTTLGTLQGQTAAVKANGWTHGGSLLGLETLDASVNGTLDNTGDLLSQGAMAFYAQTVNNGGQMVSVGDVTLDGAQLTNRGSIQGDSLNLHQNSIRNLGTLTGVSGLTLAARKQLMARMAMAAPQQQLINDATGTLQTGGTLELRSGEVTNNGSWQGKNILLDAQSLTNRGTIQSADALTLALRDTLKSTQGSKVTAIGSAVLDAQILANQGQWAAKNLMLTADRVENNGSMLGDDGLTVSAGQLIQQQNGKVLSGADMVLDVSGLSALGQIVALGNLTLKTVQAISNSATLAAGKQLTINSTGALENHGVLQGEGVTLSAGGQLTNAGKIAVGKDGATLSGSQIVTNDGSTLQSGGDLRLTSRGNITLNGFTGTTGNLTASAPGSLLNTALLYAGNNMMLYADSIKNQRGDMLAGNNLTMQKDATGKANKEIVNTSGNIETEKGDITIRTRHLTNQWLSIKQGETKKDDIENDWPSYSLGSVDIPYAFFKPEDLRVYKGTHEMGMVGFTYGYYPTLREGLVSVEIPVSRTVSTTTTSGDAGRISAAGNIIGIADKMDNLGSYIVAGKSVDFSGSALSNKSWLTGSQTIYRVYELDPDETPEKRHYRTRQAFGYYIPTSEGLAEPGKFYIKSIGFKPTDTYRTEGEGGAIRGVIQAGENVNLRFGNIENSSDSTNVYGTITPKITAPRLPSLPTVMELNTGVKEEAETQIIMQQQLHRALQLLYGKNTTSKAETARVDSGSYPLPDTDNGYFVVDAKNSRYLITVNPKLNGLGELNASIFDSLYHLSGRMPDIAAPIVESRFSDEVNFLGSDYLLNKLGVRPESTHRFLGDAVFDTRYVSNTVLAETGGRYLKGMGSDLEQMRYLLDNAAQASEGLGLQFGVNLSAGQVAKLERSILWWEAVLINDQMIMVPKVYLSPKDTTIANGSVIAGYNVLVDGGSIDNAGSSFISKHYLNIHSESTISNDSSSLLYSDGNLSLSAKDNIVNIGSRINGGKVALETINGDIINNTVSENKKSADERYVRTVMGNEAAIEARQSIAIISGGNYLNNASNLTSNGNLSLTAQDDIVISGIHKDWRYATHFYKSDTDRQSKSSTITAGGNLVMNAGKNLTAQAGDISAGKNASLSAGNDLNLNAETTGTSRRDGGKTRYSNGIDRTTVSAGEDLTLAAGRDINSQAAGLAAENDVNMKAGRDVNLLAEATGEGSSSKSKKKTVIDDRVRQQGTEIGSGGNTSIIAGRDLNAEAAQVIAQQDIAVRAGRDVNLDTATDSDYHYQETVKTKKGFLSKTKTHTISEQSATREAGSLLSGDNVSVSAGNNLLVKGSSVVGDGDVALSAGKNVDIVAATNSDTNWQFKEKKKSGLMGSGGIGFSIGTSKSRHELREKGTTQSDSVSTVGSTSGNVTITSGGQTRIAGSDVIAGKDMTVKGDNVVIEPGHDKRTRTETFEQKTAGLTLALSGSVGSMVNGAATAVQAAHKESDSRLASLKATQAALSGIQAGLQQQLAAAQGGSATDNAFQIAVSLGAQSSKSKTREESDTVTGSRLTAGGNLSVVATGKDTTANGGDITVVGSQLNAGKDVTLDAARDINLVSGQNTSLLTGSNSSHGGSVGVGLGFGGTSNGLSVSANANASSGKQKGNSLTHSNATVEAGNAVTLISGRDATLAGAQVNGKQVTADIGRDLSIASQQDIDNYLSKQSSVSGGLSYTFGGGPGGSFSFSRDKMNSNYRSVNDQSGLFAGEGGFDVTVGNHTQLDGAVLASTATADKNRLDTGTLGFGDIHNEADFKVQHQGGGFSTGGIGALIASNIGNVMLMGAGSNGHSDGTTQAAISQGTIVIRDQDKQKQDVASLSRDAQNANDRISKIFDKEKEQRRMEQAQLIGEISSQVGKIVSTYGEIAATESANEKMKGVQKEDRESARQAWEKLHPNKTATEQDVSQYLYDGFYNSALEKSEMGTGGSYQRAIQATTAIVQGLSAGNINAALAGAAAPYLANQIAQHIDKEDREARLIAHAVLGAALAAVQKQDIAAGAAGASIGELAGMIAVELKGGRAGELSEADKQTVSALATLASTLAGGLIGDSGATAVNAGLAGKNAVENNSLSGDKARASVQESKEAIKAMVRDKIGNNIASQVTNGVLNVLADTGDMAMAAGDTVFDATAALVACATGDSYCGQAQTDLNKKDQAAGKVLNSLVNGEAWGAIKETAVKASQGDQAALENFAGILAGVLIPAKDFPAIGKTSSLSETTASSINQYVKDNIALSQKARETSNFAIHSAKSDQLQWGYAADDWNIGGLKKGDKVFGGIPGQSAYYTNESTLVNSGLSRDLLFKSLQVSPHPDFGYRPKMGVYEVMNDIIIPVGTVSQNPLLGPGGGIQFFIKDYNSNLKLIDTIELGK